MEKTERSELYGFVVYYKKTLYASFCSFNHYNCYLVFAFSYLEKSFLIAEMSNCNNNIDLYGNNYFMVTFISICNCIWIQFLKNISSIGRHALIKSSPSCIIDI